MDEKNAIGETPSEEKEVKQSKRDAHIARLRKRYPEKSFEDDEELFGQIGDDYDQLESENNSMKEREKTLSDLFSTDVRSAYFINDWRQGENPVLGLIRRFGPEIKDAIDDPAMQEKIKQIHEEQIEEQMKSQKLDEEYDRNIEETLNKTLPAFQSEMGLGDEDADKILTAWMQIVKDGVAGKLTGETILLIWNALNHDSDVSNAQEEGRISGKNEKIVEKLRQSKKGDGLQALNGRNGDGDGVEKRRSIFDVAREAQ